MDEERRRILEMVRDGVINADGAERLLLALQAGEERPDDKAEGTAAAPTVHEPAAGRSFRRWWEIPFAVGLILFGAAALCVFNTSSTLLNICGWVVGLSAALIVILAWLSQWAAWEHVRIHEQDGTRLSISLPLPLKLIQPLQGLIGSLTHRFAGVETAENVDTALGMLSALGELPADQPLSFEIDDEDGDHIQVYIG